VQNVDLAPTLLEVLGLPAPERQTLAGLPPMSGRDSLDGLSLVPLLERRAQSVRDAAYIGGFGLRAGIVTEREKLIDNRGERENELFHLAADPREEHNLIDDEGDRAEQLHRELWEFCSLWARALSWRDRPAAGR
jgi:arylsulfatase A-like enzyme